MDLTGAASSLAVAGETPEERAKSYATERKQLELKLQSAIRDEKNTDSELTELLSASKAMDESLQQLQVRLSGVTQELSQLKLKTRVTHNVTNKLLTLGDEQDGESSFDVLERVTYRDVHRPIQQAFQRAVADKLRDDGFVEKVNTQHIGAQPEFCLVIWKEESASWKVHDPRDNTDVTFGALLEDVARYWGVEHANMALVDSKGAVWPFDAFVFDELSTSEDGLTVHMTLLPGVKELHDIDIEYEIDEATLPIAVRRRLDRERRAKQLARATKESVRKEKERERRALIGELIKYVVMMVLYFYVLSARRDVRQFYYFLDSVQEVFIGEEFGDYNEKAYMDIANYEEFYQWAKGPFVEAMLSEENYDGSVRLPENQRVTTYNKVVGGIRLRQTRVTPNAGCTIALNVQDKFVPEFGPDAGIERKRKYVDQCYSNYHYAETWSRRPFSVMAQETPTNKTGPSECRELANDDWSDAELATYDQYEVCLGKAFWPREDLVNPDTGRTYKEDNKEIADPLLKAFTWQDGAANGLPQPYSRQLKYSAYDGSGFVFDLTNLTTASLVEALDYLESETWLDRQTRALFVSLVVYNINYNLYAVVNFELELSLAGVIIPRYNIQAAKFDLYFSFFDSYGDQAFVIIEAFLYLGMLGYLLNEFRELITIYNTTGSVKGYFTDFWNVIDWALIGLSFGSLGMRIAFVLSDEMRSFSPFTDRYPEVTAAVYLYNSSFGLDAVAASFGIFKIFRFFDLQRNLLVLRRSVSRGISDLTSFTIVLLTLLLGFALAFMNIFGQESDQYLAPIQSFTTLFLMILGEFEFDELLRINPYFAYPFFLFFQIFVFLIMVNIFLAILNDAYVNIVEEMYEEAVDEVGKTRTLRQRFHDLRLHLRQRKLNARIEKLRKQQRQKELVEKREARKKLEAKQKTLKAIGMLAEMQGGGSRSKQNDRGAAAYGNPSSALARNEQL